MNKWVKKEAAKYDIAYASGYFPQNATRFFYQDICKFVQKYIKGSTKLLDIGCGPCFTRKMAKPYNIDVYGLDISKRLTKLWKHEGVRACVASSSAIPYKDNTFDIVMAWDVLEHIPEEGLVDTFKEIKRVGKHKCLFDYSIALTEESRKFNNMNLHVTVRPYLWWLRLMAYTVGVSPDGLAFLDKAKTHYIGKILMKK